MKTLWSGGILAAEGPGGARVPVTQISPLQRGDMFSQRLSKDCRDSAEFGGLEKRKAASGRIRSQ